MKLVVENLIRNTFNHLGLDIRRQRSSKGLRSTIAQSYSLISDLGFRPETVIDVGVASGTMELYQNFPNAYFLLIEPVKEFEPFIKSVFKKYKGEYILAAAGSRREEVTFNVRKNHPDSSSLYKERLSVPENESTVTVPMIRVDDVLAEKGLKGPYLIKVDVQGAEIDVLEGCQQALKHAEVVVLEVSLFEFMEGQPQFYDVVHYMKQRGFVAYDIILGWNRPLDNALGQIDIVFVKVEGVFRKSHCYATPEQMTKLF